MNIFDHLNPKPNQQTLAIRASQRPSPFRAVADGVFGDYRAQYDMHIAAIRKGDTTVKSARESLSRAAAKLRAELTDRANAFSSTPPHISALIARAAEAKATARRANADPAQGDHRTDEATPHRSPDPEPRSRVGRRPPPRRRRTRSEQRYPKCGRRDRLSRSRPAIGRPGSHRMESPRNRATRQGEPRPGRAGDAGGSLSRPRPAVRPACRGEHYGAALGHSTTARGLRHTSSGDVRPFRPLRRRGRQRTAL